MKDVCSRPLSTWAVQSAEDAINMLKTSRSGLSAADSQLRLKTCGKNIISGHEQGLVAIFLRQFTDPFVYLLALASFLSIIIGEIHTGMLLMFFVFLDVLFGFYQEAKAYRTLVFLKKKLPSFCYVVRDGGRISIDKSLLVPGDIVYLEAGTIVPADIRVVEAYNLLVDESMLTGESAQVIKYSDPIKDPSSALDEMTNILFAGTNVMNGKGLGVVVATGSNTQIGSIAKLVEFIRPLGGYAQNLSRLTKKMGRIAFVTIPIIVFIHAMQSSTTHVWELVTFAIALIVGIVPEAFPAVIAFSLARGALILSHQNVIVKRLSAIEDLGDIEILCVDKTGTLTENKMQVDQIFSQHEDQMLLYGLLSMAGIDSSTGFDKAIFSIIPHEIKQYAKKFERLSEFPFDSNRMRSSVEVRDDAGDRYLIVRGAPDVLMNISSCDELRRKNIMTLIEKEGREGKRTLALAYKKIKNEKKLSIDDEKDLEFLGFFSFVDPLKKSIKETIHRAKKFGIQLKILTGDSQEVASFVAQEVGLIDSPENAVISGTLLSNMSEEQFAESCLKYTVFCRVTPIIKYNIVKELQKKYSVGFLGEGINDTPALKAAHVGIAVKEAVDVAREAADIVLIRKDLSVLVSGIYEGRRIFATLDAYVKTTLASNLGNHYSIGFLAILLPFLPLLPAQILLINVLSDFPLLMIATDNVLASSLKEPKRYQLSARFGLIYILALVSMFSDLLIYGIYRNLPATGFRSLWFIFNVLSEIGLIFILRTHRLFCLKPFPSLMIVAFSIAAAILALIIPFSDTGKYLFDFSAPTGSQVLVMFVLLLLYLAMSEVIKLMYYKGTN